MILGILGGSPSSILMMEACCSILYVLKNLANSCDRLFYLVFSRSSCPVVLVNLCFQQRPVSLISRDSVSSVGCMILKINFTACKLMNTFESPFFQYLNHILSFTYTGAMKIHPLNCFYSDSAEPFTFKLRCLEAEGLPNMSQFLLSRSYYCLRDVFKDQNIFLKFQLTSIIDSNYLMI